MIGNKPLIRVWVVWNLDTFYQELSRSLVALALVAECVGYLESDSSW